MSRRGWCQHYNGRMSPGPSGLVTHTECEVGVAYESVCGPKRFPCVGNGGECAKREPYTEAQLAEREARIHEVITRIFEGRCHVCDKPSEPSTVVERGNL